MWALIQAHQLIVGVALMWLLSSAIGAMPTPHDGSSAFYEWAFKFLQTIGGALPRLLAIYSPQALNALTGQTVKTTVPSNPPITAPQIERIEKETP
jgi:hypothetical protein